MTAPLDTAERFAALAPKCDTWSIRVMRSRSESLCVTRGVVDPVHLGDDLGAMVTIAAGGGIGYAATSDISAAGLDAAGRTALAWAHRTAGRMVAAIDFPSARAAPVRFEHEARPRQAWESLGRGDKIERLKASAAKLKRSDGIVDWHAGVSFTDEEVVLATSRGDFIRQKRGLVTPSLAASASGSGETQTRTFARGGMMRQGGWEALDDLGFWEAPERIGEEALELLAAPDCPEGTMDLLLMPDQMYIQIHESIGHPLEIDRILGDERNYAGTSFVTPDMFGTYQYGSKLLNVTFDPGIAGEAAAYAFDDDGTPAARQFLIREGRLERGLGGATSQSRINIPGVANARACNWNRPPIDRMANLNLEPGASRLDDLIAQVEDGVVMETNTSWSIDDSRNKFQFGCERARLIKNGRLGQVVKNPNYRGISATFWRSLKGLGDAASLRVMGTPTCGKGEPNQAIRVGHATPPGLFENVAVFGGG